MKQEEIKAMSVLIKSELNSKIEDKQILKAINDLLEDAKLNDYTIGFTSLFNNVTEKLKKENLTDELPEILNKLSSKLKRISNTIKFGNENNKLFLYNGELYKISAELNEINRLLTPKNYTFIGEEVPF